MQGAEAAGAERRHVLGAFLAEHWRLPVPAQGEPPAQWSELEASLAPASCGACHPDQHAQWSRSLHAAAFSPGFSGQLIEGALADAANVRACQTCHAPLAEQQPWRSDGSENPRFDAGLRASGILCASCHVRSQRRYGPPRRADAPAAPEPLPHGGFEARSEFQQSRFCAECHQFFDDPGVNGKPVQNTFAEWQASPQAAAGRSCQSCHMPDRAHRWRGIHDPEMVRGAVAVELTDFAAGDSGRPGNADGAELRAALVVTSRDVGHAFPSYVTPRVFLALWQIDAAGREIEGTREETTIGRELDFATDPWSEVFDTRIEPGDSARLEYARPREPAAVALLARVTVDPDYHYRGVFESLGESLEDPDARARIREAHRRASQSLYILDEIRRGLPARPVESDLGYPPIPKEE
jgi:hypothetical protein